MEKLYFEKPTSETQKLMDAADAALAERRRAWLAMDELKARAETDKALRPKHSEATAHYDEVREQSEAACQTALDALMEPQGQPVKTVLSTIADDLALDHLLQGAAPASELYQVALNLRDASLMTRDELDELDVLGITTWTPEILYDAGEDDRGDALFVVRWNAPHYDGRPMTGDELKRLRNRAGLSQDALAKAAGVTRDALTKLESGRRSIAKTAAGTVGLIAQALGVDVQLLISADLTDVVRPMTQTIRNFITGEVQTRKYNDPILEGVTWTTERSAMRVNVDGYKETDQHTFVTDDGTAVIRVTVYDDLPNSPDVKVIDDSTIYNVERGDYGELIAVNKDEGFRRPLTRAELKGIEIVRMFRERERKAK